MSRICTTWISERKSTHLINSNKIKIQIFNWMRFLLIEYRGAVQQQQSIPMYEHVHFNRRMVKQLIISYRSTSILLIACWPFNWLIFNCSFHCRIDFNFNETTKTLKCQVLWRVLQIWNIYSEISSILSAGSRIRFIQSAAAVSSSPSMV